MSSSYEQDQIRQVAERIAQRLANGTGRDNDSRSAQGEVSNGAAGLSEIAEIRAGLSHINQRLTQIERNINPDAATTNHNTQTSQKSRGTSVVADLPNVSKAKPDAQKNFTSSRHAMLNSMYVPATSSAAHPSQERFGVGEAISELVDYFENEKACGLEPDKACDQCAMCSSRGF